ncbi:hypothetical protein CI109_105808 [Kwoniella shandongensis]|uniref:Holocytochrome c-type synthase n=1 Tax=Kwoniella shandongensis TaxID=1734106 RepID=A0A5M6C554_9TREE|nr:uncharacterized protein CI109_003147 [Kwoniella shandongensis]KAA5528615.1 hypothetical protein CI109_003147 [Kwoniella shandongensis]
MKWNIGSTSFAASSNDHTTTAGLPPNHPPIPSSSSTTSASTSTSRSASQQLPAQCPMSSSTSSASSAYASAPPPLLAKCPVPHDGTTTMNPLNNIPANLSLTKQPDQKLDLPTDRTASSIPRPVTPDAPGGEAYGTGNVWDYPSPQQFYNALVRKGWETPEDSVEVMVAIHNFLNERAWDEVMKWEKRKPNGDKATLARFTGRPGELSPKARMHLFAGKLFPERFNTTPPFDRHDWIVTRPDPSVPATSVPTDQSSAALAEQPKITTRYVIDYYSAPPDEEGNPVFSLDVRPALDNFESITQRVKVGMEEWMNGESE